MRKSIYSRILPVVILFILALLSNSCHKGAFTPVNVGREYGNPTIPLFVSHLPRSNRWALSRNGPHFFLSEIICFDYVCRKMIGRRKALHAISFEDYKRRIKKNGKKGEYKKVLTPAVKKATPVKPDTVPVSKQPELISTREPEHEPNVSVPILKADSLIILNELLFETNSFKLKGEHYAALDSIGKFLLEHPSLEVVVSGHTDNTGNERHNVALSTRRAEVVAEYLIDKGALDNNVSFEGFGSSQPIMGNETAQGRSKNRRVEILIRNPVKK